MRVITGIMVEIVFYLSNIDLSMHLVLRNAIDLAEIYCSIAEKIIKANSAFVTLSPVCFIILCIISTRNN